MDLWVAELRRGRSDAAWDAFLDGYRRLIFAAIRHYARDYDDVMDVFVQVCESLRDRDLHRLRSYVEQPVHRARFSTWLVAVVRNLTIDWFRQRDGRRRLAAVAESLSPLRRRIFECVFLEQRSHVEAYELIRSADQPAFTFGAFLVELRETYRAVTDGRRGRLLRDLGGRRPPPPEIETEIPSAADLPGRRALLEELLASLGPEDRTAIELYVLDDVPAGAVARILGLPNPKAVYNRVYRALALLRTRITAAGVGREDL